MPRRRDLLVAASVLLLCATGVAWGKTPDRSARPNFIFILTDDLGWGDLAVYGHPRVQTPNLDKLAREGMLATPFYVGATVCSPSRVAFMTGRHPARLGIHNLIAHEKRPAGVPPYLEPATPNVARVLRTAGYATAHIGKWHLGHGAAAPAVVDYGFDVARVVSGNGPGWDGGKDATGEAGLRARSTALMVDETLAFVRAQQASGKPFFVNLWTLLPHAVLKPTEEQMQPYRDLSVAPEWRSAAQVYLASVTDLDTQVGRLMRGLADLGVDRDTMVVFSSDNGPEDIHVRIAAHSGVGSAGPFRGRKRSLYEGGLRVPFIVRWPNGVEGGRIEERAILSAVDLLPTVAALAGAPLPRDLGGDGEDVSDVIRGRSRDRRAPLFWEWRFDIPGDQINRSPTLAMREGRWKLLMNRDRSRVELYDLAADSTETDNRADRNPAVVARMSKRLLSWRASLPDGPYDRHAGSLHYRWPTARADAAQGPQRRQPWRSAAAR